jgi:hypothetical protein
VNTEDEKAIQVAASSGPWSWIQETLHLQPGARWRLQSETRTVLDTEPHRLGIDEASGWRDAKDEIPGPTDRDAIVHARNGYWRALAVVKAAEGLIEQGRLRGGLTVEECGPLVELRAAVEAWKAAI